MVILFAGLPGTGKSFLAERVTAQIDGVVLDRDAIRDAIFPERYLDYSEGQNEVGSQVTYKVARYLLSDNPDLIVLLDGRPFSKQSQVADVERLAADTGHELRVVYCWAPDDVVRKRLEEDATRMQVADRTMEKYYRIKDRFEPLDREHLTLDTTKPVDDLVAAVLSYIGR